MPAMKSTDQPTNQPTLVAPAHSGPPARFARSRRRVRLWTRSLRLTLAAALCLGLNSCFTLMTVDCVDRNVSPPRKDAALHVLLPLAVVGDLATAPLQLALLGIITKCGTDPYP